MATSSTVSSPTLDREYAYYLAHRDELTTKYAGKFVVIKDGNVLGPFESQTDALTAGLTQFAAGTFLVQLCGADFDQVQYFHSRVAF